MTRLGSLIATHRWLNGLSMRDLAMNAGVCAAHISDLENGRAKAWNPSVATLFGLGAALMVDPLELAMAAFEDQGEIAFKTFGKEAA